MDADPMDKTLELQPEHRLDIPVAEGSSSSGPTANNGETGKSSQRKSKVDKENHKS